MSLSRHFKDQGEFTPKSLVPGPKSKEDDWQPSPVSDDDQSSSPAEKEFLESLHSETHSLHEEAAAPVIEQETSNPDQAPIDPTLPETTVYEPPSPMPDIDIHQAVKSSEFYIYLHPDDMVSVQDRAQKFIAGLNGLDNIVVKADPTIERGGCKVESENCTVDATISSQFKVLQESLRKKG